MPGTKVVFIKGLKDIRAQLASLIKMQQFQKRKITGSSTSTGETLAKYDGPVHPYLCEPIYDWDDFVSALKVMDRRAEYLLKSLKSKR